MENINLLKKYFEYNPLYRFIYNRGLENWKPDNLAQWIYLTWIKGIPEEEKEYNVFLEKVGAGEIIT